MMAKHLEQSATWMRIIARSQTEKVQWGHNEGLLSGTSWERGRCFWDFPLLLCIARRTSACADQLLSQEQWELGA